MFGNDMESLRIAFGTIFSEVVGWEFNCLNGDIYSRSHVEDYLLLNVDEGFYYHRPIYRDDLLSRLTGYGDSPFRYSWFSKETQLVSIFNDCSDCIWEVQPKKGISFIVAEKQIKHSKGPILFGHSARDWNCYICESFIITISEDCTYRVWDQHGRELNENRKHIRRGVWRCLCNSIFSFLVVTGCNSAIYRLHMAAEGLEKTVALESFSNRKESISLSIPRSSGYGRLMDNKTVEWTELARISEEASIIGMDLHSNYSASSNRYEVWIFGGDGKVGMTIVHIVGSEWKIEIKFTFTWTVEKDRHLLRIYWCKLPEARIFFTTDPEYVSCLGKE